MKHTNIFELDGIPKLRNAFPMAVQHIVAMIVGCVTPALIISSVASSSVPHFEIILVQSALLAASVATFIQLFPLGKYIGSRLPVIMGVSFAYLSSMVAIVGEYELATIFGSTLVGGFIAILVGLLIKKIRIFFPPMITGTVVFTIGLSLYPTAINYMAGGVGSPQYGSWENWLIALITLSIVVTLNHFARGLLKLSSILIGIVVGYIIAAFFGMVDYSSIGEAAYFQIPRVLPFGMSFEISACVAMGILFAINSIQAIGDYSATTIGAMNREPTSQELQSGIIGYGISNIISSFFGGLPTATYSQNVGIVTTTKVINRFTLGISAFILLLAALIPKFSAILTTIPQCVLGGATVSVFASIATTGMKLVTGNGMNYRNTSIVGLSAALGVGLSQSAEAIATFPSWFKLIFGKSPVVLATVLAIILNIILPSPDEKKEIE